MYHSENCGMLRKMADKVCKQCGTLQSLSGFYKHSQMADGHLNKCKECIKANVRRYAKANPEKIRKLGREKRRRPKYRRLAKQWIKRNSEKYKAYRDLWAAKNRHKRKAQHAVSNAIRDGRMIKPGRCQRCGKNGNSSEIQAHHPDYSKPLEVEWLCRACHGEAHVLHNFQMRHKD